MLWAHALVCFHAVFTIASQGRATCLAISGGSPCLVEPRLPKQAFSLVSVNTSTVASYRRGLLVCIVSPLPESKLRHRLTDLHYASCVSEDSLQNGLTRTDCSIPRHLPGSLVRSQQLEQAKPGLLGTNKGLRLGWMVHGVQQDLCELSFVPKILWRVVCGFGETMDTFTEAQHKDALPAVGIFAFAPTSALTKEDFPEFGTPRTAIWPLRSI